MLCPRCHNVNPDTNLTCDFCMEELPMTEERKKLINKKEKFEKQQKLKKSKDKIIGMVTALITIVAIVIIVMVFF